MNRRRFATALLALAAPAAAQEAILRGQLEMTYARWRGAFLQKNLEEWLQNTSKWQQLSIRNEVISSGRQWPKAVFDLPIAPPDTTPLKVLQTKVNGVQARITYFGKADFGIAESSAPDNLLLVWFLKEGQAWKVHKAQYVQVPDPETREKVAKSDLSILADEEFAMPGTYPELPKPCAAPYFVARLNVTSLGYRSTVSINGYTLSPVQDTLGGRVIIGGVQRGPNKLTIASTPTSKSATPQESKLELSVQLQTSPPRQIFTWTPPANWDGKPLEVGFVCPSKH
jgi:hypothetical protein